MKRDIESGLKNKLKLICIDADDGPNFWREFYKWCVYSYQLERKKRFAISDLGEFLLKNNVNNSREIIIAYIHILYSLAIFEGVDIYGENFII